MENIIINSNIIPDPVLHDTDLIPPGTVQRVIDIALPFLSLNPISNLVVSCSLSVHRSYVILTELPVFYLNGDWTHFAERSALLVLVIATTACSILFPFGHFALSQGFGVISNSYQLGSHLWKGKWIEATKVSAQLMVQTVFIASILLASTELIVLSLLLQMVSGAITSYSEFSEGRIPEGIASLLLLGVRGYGAYPLLQTLHCNYFGQTLTQELWHSLYLFKIQQGQKNVEEIFLNEGISLHVKNIDFTETNKLNSILFANMKFEDCNFKDCDFQGSRFHQISADSSLFENSSWVNTTVKNCHFNNCNFNSSYFNDATLMNTSFAQCGLNMTSFLGASALESEISHSDLTDTLLLNTKDQFRLENCTENKITKPVVAISWQFQNHGTFTPVIDHALGDNGAIRLRYECVPEDIDAAKLDSEVEASLKKMSLQELLNKIEEGSEMAKIRDKSKLYSQYMNGLALPGGNDIQPIYYGAVQESDTFPDDDHRKSFMEFNMISRAIEQGKPIMGTCRGSQMLNVALGGTLQQDVPDQFGKQEIEIADSSRSEWAKQFFGDHFPAFSMHHQASKKIGKDLEVILKKDEIPKLLMSKDNKILAVQFHPEMYIPLRDEILNNPSTHGPFFDEPSLRELIEKNQNVYRYFISQVEQNQNPVA